MSKVTEESRFSDIQFQPCPYHFPGMWKREIIFKPEPTVDDIQDMKDLYHMPEDGSEKAIRLCKSWGVKSINQIAEAYANSWRYQPHGFLVLDNQFVGPRYDIESLNQLKSILEQLDINPEPCLTRAKEFKLFEDHPHRSWVSGMSHSKISWGHCRPTAIQTWPFPDDKEMREKLIKYWKDKYNYDVKSYKYDQSPPHWMISLEDWFVIKKLGL